MINLAALQRIKQRFAEIQELMSQPEVATKPSRMAELGREVETWLEGESTGSELSDRSSE